MSPLRRIAVLTLAGSLLAGCWTTPMGAVGLATGVGDFASLNANKKTLGDHVATGIVGRDCSVVSYEQTGSYCPEQVVVDRSNIYCYRTLADVNCHYLPDPYKNGQTALASPPPVRTPVPPKRGWLDWAFE
ncbi:hypothetical protein [Azospirillum sp. sgz301742]